MNLLKSAEKGSTLGFALPLALVVAWLLLSGLFLAGISRPGALDASISRVLAPNKVLAQPELEPEPSLDATARAAVSADRERPRNAHR